RERRAVTLFADEGRTPLDLTTAARALAALAGAKGTRLLHVGGPERLSRYEMGVRLAASLGADPSVVVAPARDAGPAPEPPPRDARRGSGAGAGAAGYVAGLLALAFRVFGGALAAIPGRLSPRLELEREGELPQPRVAGGRRGIDRHQHAAGQPQAVRHPPVD